jgi:hypothetical protein
LPPNLDLAFSVFTKDPNPVMNICRVLKLGQINLLP